VAYRTTYAAVAKIIEVDLTITTDLVPFIEAANQLVTDVCGNYDSDDQYDAGKLELIERWLAAHFYAIRDPRAKSEHAGPVGAGYQSKVDLGLDVTHYGQMAKRLDTVGGLAELDERLKKGKRIITPSLTWLGTEDWDKNNI